MKRFNNYLLYILLTLALYLNMVFAENLEEIGLDIAKKSYENSRGYIDSQSDQLMILIDPKGNEVIREISGKNLENLDPNDGDKSIIFFKKPKDVEGTVVTSFLTWAEFKKLWRKCLGFNLYQYSL